MFTFLGLAVPGHASKLVFGSLQGKTVVVMQGRVHMYEGHTAKQVSDFMCHVAHRLSSVIVVITDNYIC